MNWIMGRTNSETFRAFFEFPCQNQNKGYTKLTVIMCCQIVAKKSVAPSSGDFRRRLAPRYVCGQDQEFWKKKSFSNIIITPLLGPRPDLRECVTSMIFKSYLFVLLGGLDGRFPYWKTDSCFFCFQKIFFSKTSWWLVINRKKFCLLKGYCCEFFYK